MIRQLSDWIQSLPLKRVLVRYSDSNTGNRHSPIFGISGHRHLESSSRSAGKELNLELQLCDSLVDRFVIRAIRVIDTLGTNVRLISAIVILYWVGIITQANFPSKFFALACSLTRWRLVSISSKSSLHSLRVCLCLVLDFVSHIGDQRQSRFG